MHACMNLLNCLELHKPAKEGITNQVTHIHTITIELTLNAIARKARNLHNQQRPGSS